MSSKRIPILLSILKGTAAAAIVTIVGMLLIALLTVFSRISDGLLTTLNQALKAISIIFGTWIAVGRGGSRGFVTGAVVAVLYMLSGYILYVSLGGPYNTADMLGELLLGSAVGAITGTILANLRPKKHRSK